MSSPAGHRESCWSVSKEQMEEPPLLCLSLVFALPERLVTSGLPRCTFLFMMGWGRTECHRSTVSEIVECRCPAQVLPQPHQWLLFCSFIHSSISAEGLLCAGTILDAENAAVDKRSKCLCLWDTGLCGGRQAGRATDSKINVKRNKCGTWVVVGVVGDKGSRGKGKKQAAI